MKKKKAPRDESREAFLKRRVSPSPHSSIRESVYDYVEYTDE